MPVNHSETGRTHVLAFPLEKRAHTLLSPSFVVSKKTRKTQKSFPGSLCIISLTQMVHRAIFMLSHSLTYDRTRESFF